MNCSLLFGGLQLHTADVICSLLAGGLQVQLLESVVPCCLVACSFRCWTYLFPSVCWTAGAIAGCRWSLMFGSPRLQFLEAFFPNALCGLKPQLLDSCWHDTFPTESSAAGSLLLRFAKVHGMVHDSEQARKSRVT